MVTRAMCLKQLVSLVVPLSLVLVARSAPADPPPPAKAANTIPQRTEGSYGNGELVKLEIEGRKAFLIRPTKNVDPQKNWVWVAPFWLAIDDGNGRLHHRMYVERFLAAGLHVAGVDVGTSCGSPHGAEVYENLYELLTTKYDLNRKARLLGQSNGGLISYAWAFRHPQSVDRIGGIYPATDFRSWPGLEKVVVFPDPGLGYGLGLDELTKRAAEFNPIDNLAPLAKAGVRIFHIHGDHDELVPMQANSLPVVEKFKLLGGDARLEVLPGLGHGGAKFYESESLVKFLIE